MDIVDAIGLVKGRFKILFARFHSAIDACPKMAEAFTDEAISHRGALSIMPERN